MKLKNKLDEEDTLKSELPKLKPLEESIEIVKLKELQKKNIDIPWPQISGKLPINSPKSVSPRVETDRTLTETFAPFTKRTKDTYRMVTNREVTVKGDKTTDRSKAIRLPSIKRKILASNIMNKPLETIILKIPELEDSPELEDIDYLASRRKVKRLKVIQKVRRSRSAKKKKKNSNFSF